MPRALSLVVASYLLGHGHTNGVTENCFLCLIWFHVFKMFARSSCIDKGKKVKVQTDEPEVSGVSPVFSTSALFNGHFKLLKATQKEKKPKQGFEVAPKWPRFKRLC